MPRALRRMVIVALALGAFAPALAAGSHAALRYQPGAETVPAALSDEAGGVVVAHCASCHSLDYITTQPRGQDTRFWRDEVTKMVNVYKAPLAPAEADAVVTVLDRKFGRAG